jgi:hypothetical protein
MANKPTPRNWNDIQIAIATGSMALTLVFWNLFAGPDRATALKRAQEQAAILPSQPVQTTASVLTLPSTTLQGNGPILLGGSAPQTQVVVQTGGRGGGGGNNNNSSSSSSTSTSSS